MFSSNSHLPPPRDVILSLCIAVLVTGCNRQEEVGTVAPELASPEPPASPELPASPEQTTEDQLRTAYESMQQGESDRAWELVQQVLIASPDDPLALRIAADVQKQRGEFSEAGDLALKAAEANPQIAAALLIQAFDSHLRSQRFEAAEEDLYRAIEQSPRNPEPHRLLAQFLNAQGRRIKASEHVRELIRLQDIRPNELLSLIDLRGPFLLTSFDEFVDDDAITPFSLGQVRRAYSSTRETPDDYLERLQQIIKKYPDNTAAVAFRCRILAETDQLQPLAAALQDLPAGIEQQPEYWFSLGILLASQDQNREAIRAFTEAIRRDPTDRESLRAMVSAFVAIGKDDHAAFLRERLSELDLIFRTALDADEEQARLISETFDSHLRPWESAAWLMQAGRIGGNLPAIIPELNSRHNAITAWEQQGTDQQIAEARLERLVGFDAEDWPMPDRNAVPVTLNARSKTKLDSEARFIDIAEQVGISTTFVSGFPLDGSPFATYQVNGGGLAVLDYDLDGRCDLYVVHSGGDPQQENSSVANELFRMLPDESYTEIAATSNTADRHFGQGVCAGDVNQDGFPDLLIANIGINTVYINQGDGSFREATEILTDNPFEWTSSLGLGDVDGDHLPELIEINYLDDPEAYAIRCTDNYMDCQPQRFEKSHDRVLRCQPDGRFVNWESIQQNGPTAKLGFGLVVANFDRKHGNDFFITNDGDFNHYWVSTESADASQSSYGLVESANLYGNNIGRGGSSQACMGVAFGDFNRDGTLDLHVTNFYRETVNLFLQTMSGIFTDEVAKLGLSKPSFGVLGFGTQAADFDNDGWLDLAVLNGHVYDGSDEGIPFEMLPQLLLGNESGFRLQDAAKAGPYWQERQLGRTLAMLDWNRDGKMDLFANHLDDPVALLQNDSPGGNWLQVELVGVSSERDAVGAEVQIKADGQSWHGWQVGGDGLMCTNEPVIHFGIGASTEIAELEIKWPSGQTQTFANVKPNRRYLVIEGRAEL